METKNGFVDQKCCLVKAVRSMKDGRASTRGRSVGGWSVRRRATDEKQTRTAAATRSQFKGNYVRECVWGVSGGV